MSKNIFESWGTCQIEKYQHNNNLFSTISIKKVAMVAKTISFFIGFILTLITATIDVIFISNYSIEHIDKYLIVNIVFINIIIIGIEFWLLFHVGFQATARYINELNNHNSHITSDIKKSLVRAVLELEEPSADLFGLSPHRKRNHWLILILYKIKVIFSNFFAKLILKKIIGRGGSRIYIPLVSTVITAFWDAWVQASVLKEVRFRLNTRMYTIHLIQTLKNSEYSNEYIEMLIRLISVLLELYGSYNINLNYLLCKVVYDNSVTKYASLSDIKLMSQVFLKLTIQERTKISEIACYLVAFKCHLHSKEEKQFLQLFNISLVEFNSTKKYFNEFNSTLPCMICS